VFVAFSGEEWGRKGSRHYVSTEPATESLAMINLDGVGRLEGKKLLILGAGTAREWRHVAMGVEFTTGIEATSILDDPGGSDQVSFHEVGVPAVQLFSGPHADYHRPDDDVGKIDGEGLIRVASFVREMLVYLSARDRPLTSQLAASTPRADPGEPAPARRVSLGTVPDFSYPGPGVRTSSILEGSPASAAGLQAGDILLAIDDEKIADLRAYADALRKHSPGDVIRIRVRRGEEELTLEARLLAR
jgi:hypothetical protein